MKSILKPLFFILFLFVIVQNIQAQGETYIPFRKGDLWGYADTSRNIVVTPEYSSVIKAKKNMFIVSKAGQIGLVTLNNKIIIPLDGGHQIHLKENYIFQNVYSSSKPKNYYFSYSGKKTFPEYIIHASSIKIEDQEYFKLKTNTGKQGLVKVKDNFEGIEEWYIDTSLVEITNLYNEKYIQLKKDGIKSRFVPGKTQTEVDTMPEAEEAEFINLDVNYGTNSKSKKQLDWKYISLEKIKVGEKYQLVKTTTYKKTQKGPQLRKDTLSKKYKQIHIFTSNHSFDKLDSLDYHTNYNITRSFAFVTNKKGKQGLVNAHGEVIIPLKYDELSKDFLYNNCKKLNFFAKKKKKWGLIDYDNKTLIPFEYDELVLQGMQPIIKKNSIEFKCFKLEKGIVAQKNGKFGVINQNGLITAFKYDAINYNRSASTFQLVSGEKHGLLQYIFKRDGKYSNEVEIQIIEPTFDRPISKIKSFDGYMVGEIHGEKSRLIGYIDLKGFTYFED